MAPAGPRPTTRAINPNTLVPTMMQRITIAENPAVPPLPPTYIVAGAPDPGISRHSAPNAHTKFAHTGDSTFFRHIDINIKDLAKSGRGANMIQGTVSLDDEQIDDCTMILPGMHKHIKEWEEVLRFVDGGICTSHHRQHVHRRGREDVQNKMDATTVQGWSGARDCSTLTAWGIRTCKRYPPYDVAVVLRAAE
jgi:hypothetical protein